jgi:hypothetical protein
MTRQAPHSPTRSEIPLAIAYRDLTIRDLADENAALRERVSELETIGDYRELAQQAIHALAAVTRLELRKRARP